MRVVAWLIDNRWVQAAVPESTEAAWAWLYARVPGLYQNDSSEEFVGKLRFGQFAK
jgi:hypothetical protein